MTKPLVVHTPTIPAMRLTKDDYDHYVAVLSLRYGVRREPGKLFKLAISEIINIQESDPFLTLHAHLAACVPLLDALKPAPDADARTQQEYAALKDAVERAALCAENVRVKRKDRDNEQKT